MGTALDAIQEAATLLNDAGMTNFDFTALMQWMPKAHRELQIRLALNSLPVIRKQSALITVLAGALNLGANQPTNLIEPIEMGERALGSSDLFDPMFQKEWPPDEPQSVTLTFWTWREELIQFLGATTDRQVRLRFTGGIAIPTQEGSPLGFTYAEAYLGPRIASLAAGSIGAKGSEQSWVADANARLEEVIAVNVKQQQALPTRRKGYHQRRTTWL